MTYKELSDFYQKHFSLGYLNTDFNTKAALIALICYLTRKLKEKKPDITHYQIIKKFTPPDFDEEFIKGLAITCDDRSYGVTEFPTFGLTMKEIPAKIKEILNSYIPF